MKSHPANVILRLGILPHSKRKSVYVARCLVDVQSHVRFGWGEFRDGVILAKCSVQINCLIVDTTKIIFNSRKSSGDIFYFVCKYGLCAPLTTWDVAAALSPSRAIYHRWQYTKLRLFLQHTRPPTGATQISVFNRRNLRFVSFRAHTCAYRTLLE